MKTPMHVFDRGLIVRLESESKRHIVKLRIGRYQTSHQKWNDGLQGRKVRALMIRRTIASAEIEY